MELKTQSKWQLFFEHAETPICICSMSNANIVDCNELTLKILGYGLTFLKKSLLTDFLLDGNPNEWQEKLLLLKTGVVKDWETKVLSKQHEIKSIKIKVIDIEESAGLCLIIMKELKTETDKIETLKKKLSFYETILMEMPTEFAVLNEKWQYLFVNPKSISDAEFREWIIGKTDYDFCRYRNKDFSLAANRHKQYNELARTKTGKEWIDEHETKDGRKKYILRQLYPYFIDGALKMNFGFGIDITERINAEKEREKILREMTIQNEELRQFAHITSHDLKEPLRTISSFLTVIKRRYGDRFDEKGLEYLQFVVDGADRMSSLLTGLKSFVMLDGDKIEGKVVQIGAQEVIRHSIANLKLRIAETGTEIIIPEDLPLLNGHPQFLIQLFQNLILNAIKFCRNKPKIEISWKEEAGFIQFAVKDNGIGINVNYQEKVFRLFNRLDKHNYEGTGMGLAICKKVVQLHQGTMWVDSDGENGSTFFFTLKINLVA